MQYDYTLNMWVDQRRKHIQNTISLLLDLCYLSKKKNTRILNDWTEDNGGSMSSAVPGSDAVRAGPSCVWYARQSMD